MYVNQLAAIVWNDEGDHGGARSRRPVVVGMALKLVKEEEKEAGGGAWKLERERFAEVVKMVQACRIW